MSTTHARARTNGWTRLLVTLTLAALIGCDSAPPPPKVTEGEDESTTQPAPAAADDRPKTSDILSGPWKTQSLGIHPLSLRVPDAWEIKTVGMSTFLRGPTPSGPLPDGQINISIAKHPPFPRDMVKGLEESEKKAAASAAAQGATASHIKVEFRDLAGARVFERQSVEPARGTLPAMMKWTLMVYVPGPKDEYIPYQLNFMDLTAEHYQKDKALLEKIISSLELDPTARFTQPTSSDPLR